MSRKLRLSRLRELRPALRVSFIWRILKTILRAALIAFILMLALVALAWFYPEKFLCVDSGRMSADVIIILGGGSHERPLRAAQLFKQHAAPRIIITGEGDDAINRKLLLEAGVPASAIEVESKSTTTQENAQFTLKLLRAENIHSAILVTSWYHSRRSLKTFEHYAPGLKFYSRPSYFAFAHEDWTRLGINKRMRLEFLKLPGYWIYYGINPF
jgi:uncharacterized SAM-binding protein YcdF (DUF218 family)